MFFTFTFSNPLDVTCISCCMHKRSNNSFHHFYAQTPDVLQRTETTKCNHISYTTSSMLTKLVSSAYFSTFNCEIKSVSCWDRSDFFPHGMEVHLALWTSKMFKHSIYGLSSVILGIGLGFNSLLDCSEWT